MKAGRELDALVAEKVMGWKRHDLGPINGVRWVNKDGRIIDTEHPFTYSTDIAAAWEVVEKMEKDGWQASGHMSATETGYWNFQFTKINEQKQFYALTKTVPYAICLAALKAIEVENVEA